jgi:MYXO-CTERM domain-containing protein
MAPISVRLGGGQSLYVNLSQGKLMRRIILFLFAALAVTSVDAASYQQIDGTIVNPILDTGGNPLQYSGGNLEPDAILQYAILTGADLSSADLFGANLNFADLEGAVLSDANLTSTNLIDADLSDADLTGTKLAGAFLWGADLSGSDFTDVSYYHIATWTNAFYYTDNEPTWRSGMDAAWRSSAGILALAPTSAVPEPAAILLALFGLAMLPRRRRR